MHAPHAAFVLALLVGQAASGARPAGTPTIPNPGFEEAAADGGPAGWTLSWRSTHSSDTRRGIRKQRPDFALDAQAPHSGRHCVRIGVARAQDDGVLTAALVPADPAVRIYRASVWIKTRGIKGTTARLVAVSLGKDGNWLGANYSLIAADRDHDWTRYVGFFEPAKATQSIRVRTTSSSRSSTARWRTPRRRAMPGAGTPRGRRRQPSRPNSPATASTGSRPELARADGQAPRSPFPTAPAPSPAPSRWTTAGPSPTTTPPAVSSPTPSPRCVGADHGAPVIRTLTALLLAAALPPAAAAQLREVCPAAEATPSALPSVRADLPSTAAGPQPVSRRRPACDKPPPRL